VKADDLIYKVDTASGTLVVNPSQHNKQQLIAPKYEPLVAGYIMAASVDTAPFKFSAFLKELDIRGHHYSTQVHNCSLL
jgi:hypothetical protein